MRRSPSFRAESNKTSYHFLTEFSCSAPSLKGLGDHQEEYSGVYSSDLTIGTTTNLGFVTRSLPSTVNFGDLVNGKKSATGSFGDVSSTPHCQ
jgi:hypothetical protein